MKKTKKLKKVTIKMGDGTFTYYINPKLNHPIIDDSPVAKKKLENANRALATDVFPPRLKQKEC